MTQLRGSIPSWSTGWEDALGRESEIETCSASGVIEVNVPSVVGDCIDCGGINTDGVDDTCLGGKSYEC